MDITRYYNKKLLRCGYTTGSCAAAAAKAAAEALLTGEAADSVTIATPAGISLTLDVSKVSRGAGSARCAVKKDAGDDPDITDGVSVFAEVRAGGKGIKIDGGDGVGRVTKPGLDQPVGAAAINSVPRMMIEREVSEVCAQAGYTGGLSVVISIPNGRKLAERTFNPRMGIAGGLSILGTSGIVEPMSSAALAGTLRAEMSVLAASGYDRVLLTIGNYGEAFSKKSLKLHMQAHVKCSNFLGDALDAAAEANIVKVLIVGHIGKLVKLGIGMTNMHSSNGDGRMETLIACALRAGARTEILGDISECVAVEAAIEILRRGGVLERAMKELGRRIEDTLRRRTPDEVETGFICFSGDDVLLQSENAGGMSKLWYIS